MATFLMFAMALACDRGSGEAMVVLQAPMEARVVSPTTPEVDDPPTVTVWVNETPIHVEDVERRLDQIQRLYRHSRRPFEPRIRDSKRQHVIERLIDKELLRQHIADSAIEVTDDEVEEVYKEHIAGVFGSTEALHRYVDEQGISVIEYRRKIRHELALDRVLMHGSDETTIPDEEIQELYERIAARKPARERVEASVILVRVPTGTSDTVRERMREALERATTPLKNREEFATLATTMSQGPAAPGGGYVGWVERGVLPQQTDEVVFQAPFEKATAPIPTTLGYEVYWVHQRRPAGVRAFDEVEELIRNRAQRARADRARQALLQELRKDAKIRFPDEPELSGAAQ